MQTKLLQSQAFIYGLLLLLLNDFILKYSYPGWFTGKLSDFAGLFIFPIFWIAFFPKYRGQILWATVLGFLWWKTPLADPFINCWNQWIFYSIRRIVDYTDYVALIAVIFAWKYSESEVRIFKISPGFVTVLTLFSFCATSAIKPLLYQFPNPQLVVYNYKVDSLRIDTDQISSYNFEADSNGVYRLIKQEERYDKYNPKVSEKTMIGDSLILVRIFASSYYNEYEHLNTYSGEVRFMHKVRKERQKFNENYLAELKYEGGVYAKEPYFTLGDDGIWPRQVEVKKHPVHISQKDTFSIRTKAFGALEELHFKHSLLHGKYIRYWNPSTVEVSGHYQQGVEVGMWEYFDSTGVKIKEANYKEGELQSVILIEGNERKKGPNAITKRRVIWAQFGMLLLCFLLLGISIYYFAKWYKPRQASTIKMNLIVGALWNLLSSVAFSIAITFFTLWIFISLSGTHLPFGWDLPIGLDRLTFLMFAIPILPFIYFLVSRRYGDFFWILLWTITGTIIIAIISFLTTLI